MSTEVISGLVGGLLGYGLAKEKPPTDAEIIEYLKERKPTLFKTISVDTSVARDNVEFVFAGSLIFVENPDTPTKSVYVRLNEADAAKVDLTVQRKIKAPFYRFFITNEAGAGTLNLIVSKTSVVEFAEAVVSIEIVAQSATVNISVVGSAIMIPIDVQASYIMLPVDIQAQYVTLDIDIVAQTVGNLSIDIVAQTIGNLSVNIAASAVTLNVDITAQTIGNLNVNVAASAITLNVDVVAQTVGNIGIDIKAQTVGNISINLAASAITLNVNLSSSSITLNVNLHAQTANINVDIKASSVTITVSVTGTANIQITAQTVGIFMQPEWAAKEGTDKHLSASAANVVSAAQNTLISYTVPGGKKLYITQASLIASNLDGNIQLRIYDVESVASLGSAGGAAGANITVSKPMVVVAGHEVRLYARHFCGANTTIYGQLGGYEI